MGREPLLIFLIAAFCLPHFACSNDRRNSGPSTKTDASTEDASWRCEVGSYYECEGPGACRGAAQCITGGMQLGECRCISGPSSMDAGVSDGSAAIDNRVCNPGQTYSCSGSGGCSGEATCEDDGRSLGVCMCPDAGTAPDAALGDGRCDNPNDRAALERTYFFGTAEETHSFCEVTCSFEENPPPDCPRECTYANTDGQISRECLSCYDEQSQCMSETGCDFFCAFGSEEECTACKCGELGGRSCADEFDTCTGIPSDTCQ